MLRWASCLLMATLGCASTSTGRERPAISAPPGQPAAALGAYSMYPPAPPAAEQATDAEQPLVEGSSAAQGEIHDEIDVPAPPPDERGRVADHPLLRLDDDELRKRFSDDRESVGSMSIGQAAAGVLLNAVRMPEGAYWTLITPGLAWGTDETIDSLRRAIEKVHQEHPGGHPLQIGHLSSKRGGHLSPHKSHQSGRDVDISFFYATPARQLWFRRASADNLDRQRTWSFVRALVTETDVEYIFINTSVQKLLKDYAASIDEDAEWLDSVFQYGSRHRWPIVRHAPGHDTHIHVRFFSPVAQEMARRLYRPLIDDGVIQPPTYYVQHKAKKGDILGRLANRYGTSVKAIMKANGLPNTRIRAGRVYRIPKKGGVALRSDKPVTIPPRRLPPPRGSSARKKSAAAEDASAR
jgi:penicillin-insensitive murein endopeptidase